MKRQTVLRRALAAFVLLAALAAPSCAGNAPPESTVARTTGSILDAATALQKGITAATDAGSIPVALGQKLTGYSQIVYDRSGTLLTALRLYHSAATLDLKRVQASEIQTRLGEIATAIGSILGEQIPSGALAQLSALVGNVMSAVSAVQAEVAKAMAQ